MTLTFKFHGRIVGHTVLAFSCLFSFIAFLLAYFSFSFYHGPAMWCNLNFAENKPKWLCIDVDVSHRIDVSIRRLIFCKFNQISTSMQCHDLTSMQRQFWLFRRCIDVSVLRQMDVGAWRQMDVTIWRLIFCKFNQISTFMQRQDLTSIQRPGNVKCLLGSALY